MICAIGVLVLCAYWCVSMCHMFLCMCKYRDVSLHMEVRRQTYMSFLRCVHLYFLFILRHTELTRLADKKAPGVHLDKPLESWN